MKIISVIDRKPCPGHYKGSTFYPLHCLGPSPLSLESNSYVWRPICLMIYNLYCESLILCTLTNSSWNLLLWPKKKVRTWCFDQKKSWKLMRAWERESKSKLIVLSHSSQFLLVSVHKHSKKKIFANKLRNKWF